MRRRECRLSPWHEEDALGFYRRFGLFSSCKFSGSVLLKTNLEWMKDCLATKSKGAVAGSNSTESKVFDHDRREGGCGSSINPKGNCASRKLIASGTPP
jgi:hypothetical protein